MYNPGQELSSLAFDKIIGGALDAVVNAQNNSSMTTVNFIKSVGFVNDENGNPVKPVYVDFKYPKEIKPYLPAVSSEIYLKIEKAGTGYTKEALDDSYELVEGSDKIKIEFEFSSDGGILAANITEDIEVKDASRVKKGELILLPKDGGDLGAGAKIIVALREAKAAEAAIYQDMTLQVPILTMLPIPFIRIATTDIELNVKINSISQTSESAQSSAKVNSSSSFGYKGWGFNANCSINASISNQKQSSSSEEVKKEYSLNIKVHAVQDDVPVGLSRILDILEESIVPKLIAPVAQGA
ncbi:MAG: DUF2589 domain-containing protein [Clostridiaceae bacterium]|jgi:hypothetical protein|nr:DUF2589 domain-containing protein [Clostridiaceae bacterium]